jgi:hypothetical protein
MMQHARSRRGDLSRRVVQPAIHPSARDAEEERPSPHVSLLVATALGFAYTSAAPLEEHIRALGALAEPTPEALEKARTTVLRVEVATPQVRADAAELLHRAARRVIDVLDLRSDPSAPGTALGRPSAGVPVA